MPVSLVPERATMFDNVNHRSLYLRHRIVLHQEPEESAQPYMDPLDFLIADSDLDMVINDVEADLGLEAVMVLRNCGVYYKVIGYLAECRVGDIAILGDPEEPTPQHDLPYDPLMLGEGEIDILAAIVYKWEVAHGGPKQLAS